MYVLYMTKIIDDKCQTTEDRKVIPNPDKKEMKCFHFKNIYSLLINRY